MTTPLLLLGFISLAVLIFVVKNRLQEYSKLSGSIDAQMARIEEMVEIQTEIRRGQAEVELRMNQTLNQEAANRSRQDYVRGRLERAYLLCQTLYDGHK